MQVFDAVYDSLCFCFPRSDGRRTVPLRPGGEAQSLSYASRHEWCDLAEEYRLHECDAQRAAVRRGLTQLVPLDVLSAIFTAAEIERRGCCDRTISHRAPRWSMRAVSSAARPCASRARRSSRWCLASTMGKP